MIAALVYAALAVAIGSALGLMRGPAAIMANPAFLLLTYGFVALIIFLVRRFYGFPRIRELARSRQWLTAFGIAISTSVVVALSEFTLLWAMPSTGAWVAGMTLGLVLVGAWIERDASLPGAKIAVLLLYVASSLTAISTLLTNLPPASCISKTLHIICCHTSSQYIKGRYFSCQSLCGSSFSSIGSI